MDRLQGLAIGGALGVICALGAVIWFTQTTINQLNRSAGRLEASAEKAKQTELAFADAVRHLESIGRPDIGSSQPTDPPNPARRLAPPFEVWDGDTFDNQDIRYRLVGVDAPGVRGRDFSCLAELYLGRRARNMLQQEFDRPDAKVEVITFGSPVAKDDYGRTLVRLRINSEDFGERLLRNDLALESNRRAGWCNGR